MFMIYINSQREDCTASFLFNLEAESLVAGLGLAGDVVVSIGDSTTLSLSRSLKHNRLPRWTVSVVVPVGH